MASASRIKFASLITVLCFGSTIALLNSPSNCHPETKTYYEITNVVVGRLQAVDELLNSVMITPDTRNRGSSLAWYFQEHPVNDAKTFYSIRNKRNSLALGALQGSKNEGAQFGLSTYKQLPEQKFLLIPTSKGCIIAVSHTKMLLSAGELVNDSSQVVQNAVNDKPNQLWILEERICDPFPYQPYQLIHDQSKGIVGVGPPRHSKYKEIDLFSQYESGEHTQFLFAPIPGTDRLVLVIFSKESLTAMDVAEEKTAKGSFLILYPASESNATGNQQFFVKLSSNKEACTIKNLMSLRTLAPNNTFEAGTNIVLHEENGTPNALWHLSKIGWIPDEDAAYRIKNRGTGKYIEFENGTNDNDAKIVGSVYKKDNPHQLFYFDRVPDAVSWFNIRNKFSNLILDFNTNASLPSFQYTRVNIPWHQYKFEVVETVLNVKFFNIVSRYDQSRGLVFVNGIVYGKELKVGDHDGHWEIIHEETEDQ